MTGSFGGADRCVSGIGAGISNGYGLDIRMDRADELDNECAAFVASEVRQSSKAPRVLDLGCGMFAQSCHLARLGADIIAIDRNENLAPLYEEIKRRTPNIRLRYFCISVTDLDFPSLGTDFTAVYSQRMLHYLTYHRAQEILSFSRNLLNPGGQCFLSVSGMKSELGDSYPHADRPVEDRFSELSVDVAEKHEIRSPVCLYTADDFQTLLIAAKLKIVRIWTSEFGNIKAICSR